MADAGAPGLVPLDRLPGGERQLHLTGFMGSGKSTVARHLARALVWSFLDLDALVARHAGKPVARIFAEEGERAFRKAEAHALRQALRKPRAVVALGGGTLLSADNRRRCAGCAVVVWLDCSLEVVRERLGTVREERPLWRAGELEALLEARLPGYRSADHRVDADASPHEVARRVLQAVGVDG